MSILCMLGAFYRHIPYCLGLTQALEIEAMLLLWRKQTDTKRSRLQLISSLVKSVLCVSCFPHHSFVPTQIKASRNASKDGRTKIGPHTASRKMGRRNRQEIRKPERCYVNAAVETWPDTLSNGDSKRTNRPESARGGVGVLLAFASLTSE